MTGIFIAIGLALIAALALKFGARVAWRDMMAPGAALLLGLAGYAWQGHPALAGHPVKPQAAARFDEQLAEKRRSIGERVGPASKWLILSDGLARQGNTEDAANVLLAGLKEFPKNADLWVGLGNALLAHGGGLLSPAADNAFRRALALEPDGVSPNYFYGLALAQSGQLQQGRAIWAALAERLPEKAELRAELTRNIALIDRMMAQRDAAELSSGQQAQ